MSKHLPTLPIKENRKQFELLVSHAIDYAKTLGASDSVAEVSEGQVYNNDVDVVEPLSI